MSKKFATPQLAAPMPYCEAPDCKRKAYRRVVVANGDKMYICHPHYKELVVEEKHAAIPDDTVSR